MVSLRTHSEPPLPLSSGSSSLRAGGGLPLGGRRHRRALRRGDGAVEDGLDWGCICKRLPGGIGYLSSARVVTLDKVHVP